MKVISKELKDALIDIYNMFENKIGKIIVPPPFEDMEEIYVPYDTFEDIFKKYGYEWDITDDNFDDFIREYYSAISYLALDQLRWVIQEYCEMYQ